MKKLWLLLLVFWANKAFCWPDWVLNPSATENVIVGVGIGNDIEAAKQNALADMTLQLTANVNVKQSQRLQSYEGNSQSTFEQHSQVSSLTLAFVGVEQLRTSEQHGQVAVELAMDKSILAHAIIDELNTLLTDINVNSKRCLARALAVDNFRISALKQILHFLRYPPPEQHIATIQAQQQQCLAQYHVRAVGARKDTEFAAVAMPQLPQDGMTEIWFKPQLSWAVAQVNGQVMSRATFLYRFTESSPPFTSMLSGQLQVVAQGDDELSAKSKAEQKLKELLHQPIAQWLKMDLEKKG